MRARLLDSVKLSALLVTLNLVLLAFGPGVSPHRPLAAQSLEEEVSDDGQEPDWTQICACVKVDQYNRCSEYRSYGCTRHGPTTCTAKC